MSFVEEHPLGYLVRIKLTPNAAFCGFKGDFVDADVNVFLKAYVHAVAEKGKANKALIELLAKELKIAKSACEILYGQTDHMKKILIKTEKNSQNLQQITSLGEK